MVSSRAKGMRSLRAVRRPRNRRRSGQGLVEMGIVVLLLTTITMGLVQYGLLYNAVVTLENITRDGARFAAVHGTESQTVVDGVMTPTDAAIRQHIRDVARGTSILPTDLPDANIVISPVAGNASRVAGNPILITVYYNITKKIFLPRFPGLSRFGTSYPTVCTMVIEGA